MAGRLSNHNICVTGGMVETSLTRDIPNQARYNHGEGYRGNHYILDLEHQNHRQGYRRTHRFSDHQGQNHSHSRHSHHSRHIFLIPTTMTGKGGTDILILSGQDTIHQQITVPHPHLSHLQGYLQGHLRLRGHLHQNTQEQSSQKTGQHQEAEKPDELDKQEDANPQQTVSVQENASQRTQANSYKESTTRSRSTDNQDSHQGRKVVDIQNDAKGDNDMDFPSITIVTRRSVRDDGKTTEVELRIAFKH
ncbi:hypothetical protein F4781DRAFT_429237 [Annulohypoxylon bovei var. microspora]|nr:hypothetical protein F4781DRAFT_429237 [Annulohypoxylon bovei var. microspora]